MLIYRFYLIYPSICQSVLTFHSIPLHYTTLYYISFHFITLHYITLHCITLHYILLLSLYICECSFVTTTEKRDPISNKFRLVNLEKHGLQPLHLQQHVYANLSKLNLSRQKITVKAGCLIINFPWTYGYVFVYGISVYRYIGISVYAKLNLWYNIWMYNQ